jgi:hypothetical protein
MEWHYTVDDYNIKLKFNKIKINYKTKEYIYKQDNLMNEIKKYIDNKNIEIQIENNNLLVLFNNKILKLDECIIKQYNNINYYYPITIKYILNKSIKIIIYTRTKQIKQYREKFNQEHIEMKIDDFFNYIDECLTKNKVSIFKEYKYVLLVFEDFSIKLNEIKTNIYELYEEIHNLKNRVKQLENQLK